MITIGKLRKIIENISEKYDNTPLVVCGNDHNYYEVHSVSLETALVDKNRNYTEDFYTKDTIINESCEYGLRKNILLIDDR